MIEHVSRLVPTLAQIAYFLWPLFLITALVYSLQGRFGRGWLRNVLRRARKSLLFTWLFLFAVWVVTLLATTPNPTLIPEPANSLIFFGGLGLLVAFEVYRLRVFPARLAARIDLHEAQAIEYFSQMDPDHFEELVAETYRALGYSARRVGQSGDHGIDIEVRTPGGERWIVQCKRYRDSVGEKYVRELYGTLVSEGAQLGVLVTSADITPPAEAWARGKPIKLVDGPALLRMMERARRQSQGSFFDRLTTWIEGLVRPRRAPAGLRPRPSTDHGGITQPVRLHPQAQASRQAAPGGGYRPGAIREPSRPEGRPAGDLTGPASSNGRVRTPPLCPRCGIPMIPHPRRGAAGFYRCENYPTCRVVVQQETEI